MTYDVYSSVDFSKAALADMFQTLKLADDLVCGG